MIFRNRIFQYSEILEVLQIVTSSGAINILICFYCILFRTIFLHHDPGKEAIEIVWRMTTYLYLRKQYLFPMCHWKGNFFAFLVLGLI